MIRSLTRAWALTRATVLGWRIAEQEHYLSECAEDGLDDSLCLREFRAQLRSNCIRQAELLEIAGRVTPRNAVQA